MKINNIITVILIIAISVFAYHNSRYVLNDDDQVVITQFGKVAGVKDVPGEYFKIPILQKINYFSKKTYQTEWEQQLQTNDKKYIRLKTKSLWGITDPVQYYIKLTNYNAAQNFIKYQVGVAEQEFIASHSLSELLGIDSSVKFNDVECDHRITSIFMETAKDSVLQAGISLNDIEVSVTIE